MVGVAWAESETGKQKSEINNTVVDVADSETGKSITWA